MPYRSEGRARTASSEWSETKRGASRRGLSSTHSKPAHFCSTSWEDTVDIVSVFALLLCYTRSSASYSSTEPVKVRQLTANRLSSLARS